MDTKRGLRALVVVALVGGSLALAACGSDNNDKSSTSSSGSVDIAAATTTLAPFTGKPSAFPVDEPLAKKPAASSQFHYLQCVTAVCGLFGQLLKPATQTLGVGFKSTKAGASAEDLQSAMDSIISTNPSAVILPAVEPTTVNQQLAELNSKKIPTLSNGVMNAEKYGIDAAMFGTSTAALAGKILAAWTVKETGAKTNAVFYTTPELSFGPVEKAAFLAEIKNLCPDCKVRNVDIPVATIGNKAPAQVVSDLQANPDTNVAVFSTEEAASGLAAALKTAGLAGKVKTTGFAPSPEILQNIKTGGITSGLGLDVAVEMWTQVDSAARLTTGEPLTKGEKLGIPPMQILEQKDLGFDVSKGWSGYPDFPKRFAKLWAGAQQQ